MPTNSKLVEDRWHQRRMLRWSKLSSAGSCAALICTACPLSSRQLIFGSVCAFVVRKVLQNPLYDPGVPLKAPMLAVCPRDSATNCGGLGCDERSHRNPQGCFGKSPTTPRLRNDIARWELFELRDDARACRCLRCGARNHAKRMPQLLHASATRVYTQAVTICGHVYAA